MSMEFRKLLDKEELILDTKRLSEWKRNAGKTELIEKIDDIVDDFIMENELTNDFENITIIYKFASKVKDII